MLTKFEMIELRMPKKPKVNSVAYSQGATAFAAGIPYSENPYSSSGKGERKEWFDGYFDARLDETIERVRRMLFSSKY